MESGKIGRLTEVVLFKLVQVLNAVLVDGIGLAFFDHFAGKVFP